jgi:hypothetical protein
MAFIAILSAIAVVVWFYKSAITVGQSGVKWSAVGVVGYWIAWWIVKLTVVSGLSGLAAKGAFIGFIVLLLPTVAGLASVFLVRKKLLADASL